MQKLKNFQPPERVGPAAGSGGIYGVGAAFCGDFRTGGVIDITPDLIIPYAEECTNDDRGARVENFTGLFATTRWIDLPRGSYQVCINYVNDGEDGEVSFLDEIMPTAQYDAAKLPAERTRTVFSLWMPYGCETAQLQFTADCGKTRSSTLPAHRSYPPTRGRMCGC